MVGQLRQIVTDATRKAKYSWDTSILYKTELTDEEAKRLTWSVTQRTKSVCEIEATATRDWPINNQNNKKGFSGNHNNNVNGDG